MAKLHYEIEPAGAKLLLSAIVEQAVSDLRSLQRQGVISGGRIVPNVILQKYSGKVKSATELLYFFQPGGLCEQFCGVLNFNRSFKQVRQALNLQ